MDSNFVISISCFYFNLKAGKGKSEQILGIKLSINAMKRRALVMCRCIVYTEAYMDLMLVFAGFHVSSVSADSMVCFSDATNFS